MRALGLAVTIDAIGTSSACAAGARTYATT
jgi:hypothetical protein